MHSSALFTTSYSFHGRNAVRCEIPNKMQIKVAYPFLATSDCANAQRPGKYSGHVSIRCPNTSLSDKPLFTSVSPVDGETRVKPFPCFSLPPVDIQKWKYGLADSESCDFAMLARVTRRVAAGGISRSKKDLPRVRKRSPCKRVSICLRLAASRTSSSVPVSQ